MTVDLVGGGWAEKVVDSIFDVILITDLDGLVLDTNDAIFTELGYTEEEVRGKSIYVLANNPDELRACYLDPANGHVKLSRMELKKKDGALFFFDCFVRKVTIGGDELFAAVFHNVHERALARKELEDQKSQIEQALKETEELRKQAETSKIELALANDMLAKRQQVTEAALLEEQRFRLSSVKTGFQKTFVTYLVILIGASLILPYIGSLLVAGDKITDHTANLSLLLIQAMTGVSGFIFGQRSGKSEDNGDA